MPPTMAPRVWRLPPATRSAPPSNKRTERVTEMATSPVRTIWWTSVNATSISEQFHILYTVAYFFCHLTLHGEVVHPVQCGGHNVTRHKGRHETNPHLVRPIDPRLRRLRKSARATRTTNSCSVLSCTSTSFPTTDTISPSPPAPPASRRATMGTGVADVDAGFDASASGTDPRGPT